MTQAVAIVKEVAQFLPTDQIYFWNEQFANLATGKIKQNPTPLFYI